MDDNNQTYINGHVSFTKLYPLSFLNIGWRRLFSQKATRSFVYLLSTYWSSTILYRCTARRWMQDIDLVTEEHKQTGSTLHPGDTCDESTAMRESREVTVAIMASAGG